MIDLAIEAARAAGALMRQPPRSVVHKGAVDLVTAIDLACEETIREILGRGAPGIPIYAEEGGGPADADTRWIVDPLDGTTNFVHGFPSYCASIALQVDGALRVGVVYDPVMDACYAAQAGGGATLNGAPMRVSQVDSLGQALVASGFAYDRRERADWYLRGVKVFLERSQGFRRAGAAALDMARLAAGQLDGYWEFGLNAWDVAAGILLVREAGGRVTDVAGGPVRLDAPRVLATNKRIHDEMAQTLASAGMIA